MIHSKIQSTPPDSDVLEFLRTNALNVITYTLNTNIYFYIIYI